MGDLRFPLGVYPVEPMKPRQGYSVLFEAADGDDESGEWEAWPDRYVYDIVITADRLPALCRSLFSLLPTRIYPILDVIGHDAFREIDPYISWDLIGLDQLLDAVARYHDFFYEDGMCGFGAMLDDPFLYVFVDEHKIVTVRAEPELQPRVERVLHAFDLEMIEEPAGSDAAAHEHRSVLLAPDDNPSLLNGDEVVESLRDEWRLSLNVDPDLNVDDDGRDLGVTGWRCLVRVLLEPDARPHYAEVLLLALSLTQAEQTAYEAAADEADRQRPRATPSSPAQGTTRAPATNHPEPASAEAVSAGPTGSGQDANEPVGADQGKRDESQEDGQADEFEPMLIIVSADRLEPEEFAKAIRSGARSSRPPEPRAGEVCRLRWS